MLCYALYKNDNHFWGSDDNARRAWLQRLRVAGLVNVDDANFRTVHYKIHPIAWAYMKLHPNQFINSVLWQPWIFADGREVEADAIVEKQVAENSRKTWWRFPGSAAATAIKLRKTHDSIVIFPTLWLKPRITSCCSKASVRFRFSEQREILLTVLRGISFCSSGRGTKAIRVPCAIMTSYPRHF
jgi:hypothetical protein